MSVEVKYIVKRKGKEVMSSMSQKEANAYDKMLDISDELSLLLEGEINKILGSDIDEKKLEELCIYVASNRDKVSKVLRGLKLEKEDDEDKTVDEEKPKKSVKKK